MKTQRANRAGRGFTLTELLVVIGIVVLLMVLAVPAFSSMLASAARTRAETQLQVAVAAARDAAVRSVSGGDTVLAFFYDLTGEIRMQVMVSAGTITDQDEDNDPVEREIFVPDPITEPLTLPRGWMARGYVAPGTLLSEEQLFEITLEQSVERQRGQWVFPETPFYDGNEGDNGVHRQSFVLRFRAGTGRPATGETHAVLLVDPSPWLDFRGSGDYRAFRVDEFSDKARFVQAVKVRPEFRPGSTRLSGIVGDRATDTVLAAPAREVALYREIDLANAFNARLDRVTGSIYRATQRANTDGVLELEETTNWQPQYVQARGGRLRTSDISDWIEGREIDPQEAPEARLFALDQSSGSLREVLGSDE